METGFDKGFVTGVENFRNLYITGFGIILQTDFIAFRVGGTEITV